MGPGGRFQRRTSSIGTHQQIGQTSDEVEKSPKLPWRADWQFVCTGCGAEDGITPNWKASVRTRDSLDILMV